jgi:hypothetical protein
MVKVLLISVALMAGMPSGHAQALVANRTANLVVNGSFDTPATRSELINGNNLPGWTRGDAQAAESGAYSVVYRSAAETRSPGAFLWPGAALLLYQNPEITASPDGGSFIAIDSDPTFRAGIQQAINGLVPGRTYQLSFYYAGSQPTTRTGATTEWWDVNFGGRTQRTEVLTVPRESFSGWRRATMIFVASRTSELLSFLPGGEPSAYPPISMLDGVVLSAAPSDSVASGTRSPSTPEQR